MGSLRFIVGVDGSEPSRCACRLAAELVEASGALVKCVYVRHISAAVNVSVMATGGGVDVAGLFDDEEAAARALVAETFAGSAGYWGTEIREFGDVAATLQEAARDWGADIIIVGNPGMHGVHRIFGSVATHLVHHAEVPVLMVPTD